MVALYAYILKAVLGAVAYVLQYHRVNLSGELAEWGGPDVKTITHFDIDGLIPGATYEFRFASISSAGTSDFSTAISKIVIWSPLFNHIHLTVCVIFL